MKGTFKAVRIAFFLVLLVASFLYLRDVPILAWLGIAGSIRYLFNDFFSNQQWDDQFTDNLRDD